MRVAPIYLLLDLSGSTERSRFAAAYNRCLPQVIDQLSGRPGPSVRVTLVTYATSATVRIHLAAPGEIEHIPMLRPGGFGSLAAGFDLLAGTVSTDLHQLAADGCESTRPLVVVVADDLPTDTPGRLLRSREALRQAGVGLAPSLTMVVPATVDVLAVRGLRPSRLVLFVGDPLDTLGDALTDALQDDGAKGFPAP